VNCATIPENLLESELFGHVKGAFTGATENRVGLMEEADGGTLFLDEIAEMAPPLQAKLLHALESSTVRAVGSNRDRNVDVRIVAATHQDLRQRIESGTFREDLLYRLNVVTIELPALRHRKDDITLLVDHFLSKAKTKHPSSVLTRVGPDALEKMLRYPWPGNVRELEHVIERAVILARDSVLTAADLPASMSAKPTRDIAFGELVPMRELQRRYAQWAFEQFSGRKPMTAEKLGIDFATLAKLLGSQPGSEE
jgi:two-component system response regulator HydG